jgi:transposase InsO family protein
LVQRKFPTEKEVLRFDGSPRSERQHNKAGQVRKEPNDDSSQGGHATMMPPLDEGPATGSVRPGSNICGAQLFEFLLEPLSPFARALFACRLDHARRDIEGWCIEYNNDRPHSSLGDLTPNEHAQTLAERAHQTLSLTADFTFVRD